MQKSSVVTITSSWHDLFDLALQAVWQKHVSKRQVPEVIMAEWTIEQYEKAQPEVQDDTVVIGCIIHLCKCCLVGKPRGLSLLLSAHDIGCFELSDLVLFWLRYIWSVLVAIHEYASD